MTLWFLLLLVSYSALSQANAYPGGRSRGLQEAAATWGSRRVLLSNAEASSVAASEVPKPAAANYSRPNRAWLYLGAAAHFPGATIQLQHCLDHYMGVLGYKAENILLVINFRSNKTAHVNEFMSVLKLLSQRDLKFKLWTEEYSAPAHVKYMYQLFLSAGVQPHDWLAITDLDELHEYPITPVDKYIEALEAKGENWVQGWMVDRLAEGGVLPAVADSPAVSQQFPLRCLVVPYLYKGAHCKVAIAKAYLRRDLGNHDVVVPERAESYYKSTGLWELTPYSMYPKCYISLTDPQGKDRPAMCADEVWWPRKAGKQIEVGHFKWHEGLLASARRRLAHYRGPEGGKPRVPWYTQSEAVVQHLEQNGMKVNVTMFKCWRK